MSARTTIDVEDAYARSRAAQPAWAARPLDERIGVIERFRKLVDQRQARLAELLTADMAKPITQSRNELAGVLPRIDFFVEQVPRVLVPETVLDQGPDLREVVSNEPLGVVANISAWNYPWFVGSNVFVPALLTGNAVLYKPSELVPRTGGAITAMLHEAGVPDDVFTLVDGGPEAGASLVEQPVDGVFFTGSFRTGRSIAEATAGRMIRVQLELGGKDPIYVADDVDPATVAPAVADGAFYNNGQSCCSVERIYVHRSIHDKFVESFVGAVESFVVGDPDDEATYVGPLARPQQIDVLEAQVADAVARGAVVRSGGARLAGVDGAVFAPTVLTAVDNAMAVMRDESFGPVIGIMAVDDDEQAITLMNDTDYGLTAGVYSTDESRARSILERIDAGSVYWNCCDRVSPRLPWSGRHHSGIGSTLGTAGIRSFVQPKAWHLRR
jgi:acyl-CoA reductase-like NAD-dependent aldehyde dehydrogenase